MGDVYFGNEAFSYDVSGLFFLDDICNFLRLPRSEGVIDSLFLITYLALRIGKGEMDDNNNATYMMQGSNFILWATRKSYGRNVCFG